MANIDVASQTYVKDGVTYNVKDGQPANTSGLSPTPTQLANRYGAAVSSEYNRTPTPLATPVPGAPVSPLDQAEADYYKNLQTNVDPEAIREQTRKQMQGQIDSVNALYANLTAAQTKTNSASNDRVRGLNVGAGLAGSDFATASAMGQEEKNAAALEAINREREAKVSEVLGNIDLRASEEITRQKGEAQKNQKDYIDYLKGKRDTARTDLGTLAKSGVSLDQLSTEQYQKLLSQTEYDDFTLRTVYNNARTAATKIDYQWKTVGNKLIGYGVDPLSGAISTLEKDLPAEVPANYKPQVLDNGTIIFYPETIDPSKPVKDQIVTYDTGVRKDTRTDSEKNDAKTQTRLGPATSAIDQLRDPQSGYVDPAAFSDMYAAYIKENPGKGKEFLDNFPVTIYIDPAERSKFSTSGY